MSNLAFRLSSVVVLLGQFPALSGVDMELKQGETVLVTGANGAGKTTLLRLLAGLLRPTSGSGQVQGIELNSKKLDGLRARTGMVSTHSMLYEDLTIMQNLKFWTKLWGIVASDSDAEIKAALDYLQINPDLWSLPVRVLSTGQKKRTALALQVVRRPSLWLLDEPHAGLDKKGRDILDEIIQKAAKAGAGVVLVSHETQRASSLADRSLELAGGRFI